MKEQGQNPETLGSWTSKQTSVTGATAIGRRIRLEKDLDGSGLGGLGEHLSSIKSSGKLLEGFDTRNGQALPSCASPFQVRPRHRAGLADVVEEVRGN